MILPLALLAGLAAAEPSDPGLAPWDQGPPAVPAPAPLSFPVPEVHALSDGTPVWLLARPGLPLVHVSLSLQGGLLGAEDPAAAALASTLLDEGTTTRDATAWADATGRVGAEVAVRLSALSTRLDLGMVVGQEAESLALAREALVSPRLPRRALRPARREAVRDAETTWLAPGRMHDLAVQRALYPPDHPLGEVVGAAELRRVGRRSATRAWQALLAEGRPAVVVIGDTSAERILPLLDQALTGLPGAGQQPATVPPLPPPRAGPRRVLVDFPGLQRAFLSVLVPVPGLGEPDAPAVDLLLRAVASEFDSRLSAILREEHGWTYVVVGTLRLWPGHGLLEVRCAVDAAVTPAALVVIDRELRALAEHPPGGAELARAKAAARRDAALRLLSDGQLAEHLAARQAWALDPASAAADLDAVAAVSEADLAAAAARSLPVDRAVWVITGDRAVIEPLLDAAELPLDAIRDGRGVVDGSAPLPL